MRPLGIDAAADLPGDEIIIQHDQLQKEQEQENSKTSARQSSNGQALQAKEAEDDGEGGL